MADVVLDLAGSNPSRHNAPSWLRVRFRLFRRRIKRDLFAFGRNDRLLADIGRSRPARYDWLAALMRR